MENPKGYSMATTAGILISLAAQCASAEQGPISPDRPGLSTGTHTVAPGVIYLESGFQYEFTRTGTDTSTYTLPQAVIRKGLTDKIELDIIWDGWNQDRESGLPRQTSRADLSLGGKYRLHQSEQLNLTLMGLVSLPVGSDPSTSDTVEPYAGLLWDYALSDNAQLFGVLQTTRLENETEDGYFERQIGLGLGYSHSDRLASFVEYFASSPTDPALENQHILNAGLTYLYSNDTQLDISAGAGLNDATSHFISVGIATRF